MNHFKMSLLAISCAAILTGCSSSDDAPATPTKMVQRGTQNSGNAGTNNNSNSNSSQNSSTEQTKQPETKQPETKQPETKQPETSGKNGDTAFGGDSKVMTRTLDGGVVTAKKGEYSGLKYGALETPKSSSKDVVILEGVEINTKTITEGGFTARETSQNGGGQGAAQLAVHSGNLLADVRYGGVADVTNTHFQNDTKQGIFVQGNPSTQDVVAAQKGEATYEGYGLHFKNGHPFRVDSFDYVDPSNSASKFDNTYLDAVATKVSAKVNFDKKTIGVNINRFSDKTRNDNDEEDRLGGKDGVLKANARDMENLSLNGELTGNTFSNKTGSLQGGFYGAAADQLAGMYESKRGEVYTHGVFGAKRQDEKAATTEPATPVQPTQPAEKPKTDTTNNTKPISVTPTLSKGALGQQNFVANDANITTLVINGTSIDLSIAKNPVKSGYSTSEEFLTDRKSGFIIDPKEDTATVTKSTGLSNVVYGLAQLKDGSYTTYVQGKLADTIPSGKATYKGTTFTLINLNDVSKDNWLTTRSGKVGTFTADVDFSNKTLTGAIDTNDNYGVAVQKFSGTINGSNFTGTWDKADSGSLSGGFYGATADEMAGQFDYAGKDRFDTANKAFGVFGGKKQ